MRAIRLSFLLLAASVLTACTEPVRSDIGDLPYRVSPRGVRVFGTSRILVIPAAFAGGAAPPMSGSSIRAGYFMGADGGPVAAQFGLASAGRFRLVGEVTDWVQTRVRQSELGQVGIIAKSREGDYVLEAIRAVDHVVDFGRYDNDGPDGFPNSGDDDGVVDGGVVILNSDRNTTCGIAGAGGVHPHALLIWRDKADRRFSTEDAYVTAKDSAPRSIEVGAYVSMGVLSCGSDVGANVMAHELGHLLLGLPDLYHVVGGGTQVWEGRRWVVGCWELMAAGSGWGCGTGTPTSSGRAASTMGAWSRVRVGWSDPIVAPTDRDTVYTLHAPAMGGTVLRVPVADSEYFLLEYRESSGPDQLPPSNGVLIYHIDERLPAFPAATAPRKYRVRLVEADDGDQLIRTEGEGGDRGAAGDAFGISRKSFGTGTHSGALTTAGAPLPFSITDITIDAANHRATVRIKPS
jgi:M6 family metalloprotease-like protein